MRRSEQASAHPGGRRLKWSGSAWDDGSGGAGRADGLPALCHPGRRQVLVQRACLSAAQRQRTGFAAPSAGRGAMAARLCDGAAGRESVGGCALASTASEAVDNGAWGSCEASEVSSGRRRSSQPVHVRPVRQRRHHGSRSAREVSGRCSNAPGAAAGRVRSPLDAAARQLPAACCARRVLLRRLFAASAWVGSRVTSAASRRPVSSGQARERGDDVDAQCKAPPALAVLDGDGMLM
jgi:hypothetical protein